MASFASSATKSECKIVTGKSKRQAKLNPGLKIIISKSDTRPIGSSERTQGSITPSLKGCRRKFTSAIKVPGFEVVDPIADALPFRMPCNLVSEELPCFAHPTYDMDEQDSLFLESLKPRCPPPHAISEYIFEDVMEHLERAPPDSAGSFCTKEAIGKRFHFLRSDVLNDILAYWQAKRGQAPRCTLMPTHLKPAQGEYNCFRKPEPPMSTRAKQHKQDYLRNEVYQRSLELRKMLLDYKGICLNDVNKSMMQQSSLQKKQERFHAEYEKLLKTE